MFSFRYWWLILTIFILSSIGIWMVCNDCGDSNECDFDYLSRLDRIDSVLTTIPHQPTENCRVHFSGVLMGSEAKYEVTKIYELDQYSEFVGSGYYPDNRNAFPKAVRTTFDGIAIDKGTHLIIYEKPNYEGKVVLDIVGPALIYNVLWINDSRYNRLIDAVFPEPLQSNYPRSVRTYSSENMHPWSNGSCRIMCD